MPRPTYLVDMLCPDREPDTVIGNPSDPYLLRWHLKKPTDSEGGMYLHKILRSDDDRMLHDHPYDSVSILLTGQLSELHNSAVRMHLRKPAFSHRFRIGEIRSRLADDAHRLLLYSQEAWTLFLMGPRKRQWGFWYNDTHWVPYTLVTDPNKFGQLHEDWRTRCEHYLAGAASPSQGKA